MSGNESTDAGPASEIERLRAENAHMALSSRESLPRRCAFPSHSNNDNAAPKPETNAPGVAALVAGSESEIIIAELTGAPIRKLNRERMLVTGDNLCNRFGQQLWTVEAFHPKGVRVTQWPQGGVANYTWEALYGFYERVPANDPALQNRQR